VQDEHETRGNELRNELGGDRRPRPSACLPISGNVSTDTLGKHAPQVLVKDCSSSFSDSRLAQVSMAADVLEERQTESDKTLIGTRGRGTRRHLGGAQQLVHCAQEQLVFVAKVGVEGRSADIRAEENVPDRDLIVALLADQVAEGTVQERTRLLDASVEGAPCRGGAPSQNSCPTRRRLVFDNV